VKRLLLILAIAIGTIGLSSASSYACRGPFPKTTLQKEAKHTPSIFLGKITSISKKTTNVPTHLAKLPGEIYEVKFQVNRSWKGQVTSEITVLVDGSSCGLNPTMAVGGNWLVFAGGQPLYTNVFSRFTQPIQHPDKELREIIQVLGKGQTVD
jgi:hypothetical protein